MAACGQIVLLGMVMVTRGAGQVRPSQRVIFQPEISTARPETFWNSTASLEPVSNSEMTIVEAVNGCGRAEICTRVEALVALFPMSSRAVTVAAKDRFTSTVAGSGPQS